MPSQQSKDYAPSSFSEATTNSDMSKPDAAGSKSSRRSMKQRMKQVIKDMGNPPTYRYDQEHGKAGGQVPSGPWTDHRPGKL